MIFNIKKHTKLDQSPTQANSKTNIPESKEDIIKQPYSLNPTKGSEVVVAQTSTINLKPYSMIDVNLGENVSAGVKA